MSDRLGTARAVKLREAIMTYEAARQAWRKASERVIIEGGGSAAFSQEVNRETLEDAAEAIIETVTNAPSRNLCMRRGDVVYVIMDAEGNDRFPTAAERVLRIDVRREADGGDVLLID